MTSLGCAILAGPAGDGVAVVLAGAREQRRMNARFAGAALASAPPLRGSMDMCLAYHGNAGDAPPGHLARVRLIGRDVESPTRRSVARWPLVTVFGFIAQPATRIFPKPTVTRSRTARLELIASTPDPD
jgi:hypothetical protein